MRKIVEGITIVLLLAASIVVSQPKAPVNICGGTVQVLPDGSAIASFYLTTTEKTYDYFLLVDVSYTSNYLDVVLMGDDPSLNPFILPLVEFVNIYGKGIGTNFNYTVYTRMKTVFGEREIRMIMVGKKYETYYTLAYRVDLPGNFTEEVLRKTFEENMAEYNPVRVKIMKVNETWIIDAIYHPYSYKDYITLIEIFLRGFPGLALTPDGEPYSLDFPTTFPATDIFDLRNLGAWEIFVRYPFQNESIIFRRFTAVVPDSAIASYILNFFHPLQPWGHLFSLSPALHKVYVPKGFNSSIYIELTRTKETVLVLNLYYTIKSVVVEDMRYYEHFDRFIPVYCTKYNVTFVAPANMYFYFPDLKKVAKTIRVTSAVDAPEKVALISKEAAVKRGLIAGAEKEVSELMYYLGVAFIVLAVVLAVLLASMKLRGGRREAKAKERSVS